MRHRQQQPTWVWHREIARWDQAVTVALTAPLLHRYGYPMTPPSG